MVVSNSGPIIWLSRINQFQLLRQLFYQELAAQALLVDELKARNIASESGLQVIGTVGILLMACEQGLQIDLKVLIDQMRRDGFHLSEQMYREILSRTKMR